MWLVDRDTSGEGPDRIPLPEPLRAAVPVNATVPAVGPSRVPEVLARFPGCRVAKVKVAEPGQSLSDDVDRVAAARAVIPRVRIDANGKWSVAQAISSIRAIGEVEYAEQPCATVDELAQVRRAVDVPIAADESIRLSSNPLEVVHRRAADAARCSRPEGCRPGGDRLDCHVPEPPSRKSMAGGYGPDLTAS